MSIPFVCRLRGGTAAAAGRSGFGRGQSGADVECGRASSRSRDEGKGRGGGGGSRVSGLHLTSFLGLTFHTAFEVGHELQLYALRFCVGKVEET